MIVLCNALEASQEWGTDKLQVLRSMLMDMQAKTVPDLLTLPSFGAAYLRSGDVLYIPPGFLVLEKSVNDTDISLRRG